jgi:hypothetical protein
MMLSSTAWRSGPGGMIERMWFTRSMVLGTLTITTQTQMPMSKPRTVHKIQGLGGAALSHGLRGFVMEQIRSVARFRLSKGIRDKVEVRFAGVAA